VERDGQAEEVERAREHALAVHERAVRLHQEAADRHKEAADFSELHAANEREFGNPGKAEAMEARADRARGREARELERADVEHARILDYHRRFDR
jgi:hypothetical protein